MTGHSPRDGAVHHLFIEERARTTVSGVTDVERFDDRNVVLYTDKERVTFRGEGFSVSVLSLETGEIIFDGTVCSVVYDAGKPRKSEPLLSRLFK